MRSLMSEARDEDAALEALHADGYTDGLPVVIPTVKRVEAIVPFAGLDPDVVLGTVGPQHGEATVEKVAINAVMAGCLPEHLPVVVAAVRAVCADEWDLTEAQSTTHSVGPCIIVNGPIRHEAGIWSGTGALGPGHRANAAIGRALRLVLINIGGGRPGVSDMALLGQPGKFTCCFAEAEESSPFEPLHVARGMPPDSSAVTVVGTEGPHQVFCLVDDPSLLLQVLVDALSGLASTNTFYPRSDLTVLLTPGHAALLAKAGYDRPRLQAELHGRAGRTRGELRAIAPYAIEPGDDDDLLPITAEPRDILIAVAGDAGMYSAVLPSWAGARHGNRAVTVEVLTDTSCEIP